MRQPKNRVIVNGIDLFEEFGLVVEDGYELPVAKAITSFIEVEGANGSIDATEANGFIAYANRIFSLTLAKIGVTCPAEFEAIKTKFAAFLNGRRFNFSLAMDPGYLYSGRFCIDESYSAVHIGRIKISIETDPYKLREVRTYRINAAGGIVAALESGRMQVRPKIEVQRNTLITLDGKTWSIKPGTWEVDDLWLHEGVNKLTINTYPEYSHTVWADYAGSKWSDFSGWLVSKLAAGNSPLVEADTWEMHSGQNWGVLLDKTWLDLCRPAKPGDEYAVYINYQWKDL